MKTKTFTIFVILGILLASFYSIYFHFKNNNDQEIPIIKPISQKLNKLISKTSIYNPQALTLDQIFSSNHNWTATLSAQKTIKFLATGDVIPARSVNFRTTQNNDFKWPWLKVADTLKKADLTFINLESPLIDNCPTTQEGMVFCGDSRHIEGLLYAGVDIASFANNHLENHGEDGVGETKKLLKQNGIAVTGANNSSQIPFKNKKISILAYNEIEATSPFINKINHDSIKKDIALAKKGSDIVIVTYHWGAEYQSQPEQYRIELAHQTIDWGADLIIGNHPHWIQPVEIYKGKIITYAHGNFIFDQEWSQETKEGVAGIYTFYENKVVDVEFLPVLIENYGQPKFLDGSEKQKMLDKMKQESQILTNKI